MQHQSRSVCSIERVKNRFRHEVKRFLQQQQQSGLLIQQQARNDSSGSSSAQEAHLERSTGKAHASTALHDSIAGSHRHLTTQVGQAAAIVSDSLKHVEGSTHTQLGTTEQTARNNPIKFGHNQLGSSLSPQSVQFAVHCPTAASIIAATRCGPGDFPAGALPLGFALRRQCTSLAGVCPASAAASVHAEWIGPLRTAALSSSGCHASFEPVATESPAEVNATSAPGICF